jgi:thiol-disulfide isomerase/thioredoxin
MDTKVTKVTKKTYRKRLFVSFVCFVSMVTFVAFVNVAAQAPYFDLRDPQRVIDAIDVVDLEGKRWTAADLRGRVVLVDFWATWCAPCVAQIPELKRLRDRFGSGFEVLAISLDSRPRRDLIAWLNQREVEWPQVHDGRAFSSPATRAFGVVALPASILLVDGRIAAFNLRGPQLEQAIAHLLSTSSFDAARVPIVIR